MTLMQYVLVRKDSQLDQSLNFKKYKNPFVS